MYQTLGGISDKKASCIDGISVNFLKKIGPFICNTVTEMFNRALIDSVYPAQWKVARVTPIFKDGDSNDPSNYCPMYIFPVLSKAFESTNPGISHNQRSLA